LGLRQSLIFCDDFFQHFLNVLVYIQYSVRSLVCRIHNTASNSVNSLRAGLGMFYMFGRTGAQDKRSTDQSYRKQRDILGLCYCETSIFKNFLGTAPSPETIPSRAPREWFPGCPAVVLDGPGCVLLRSSICR